MSDREESAYVEGNRVAWAAMLQTCLRQLGYDDPAVKKAAWVCEREAAVAALRRLCRIYGDNDWPDGLHLADVIDKHLGDHLNATT